MIPKFRVFYKKEMRNVLVIDWLFNHVDLSGGIIEIPFDEVELMQSTGMKDMNGVEIYESDIVIERFLNQYGEHKIKRVVKWQEKKLGWNLFNPFSTSTGMNYEVIGNIHEHSHLLEDKS